MMRSSVSLFALLFVPLLASGQPGPKAQTTYIMGAAQAVRAGQPLVAFLGCPDRAVEGAVVVRVEALTGYDGPAAIFAGAGAGLPDHRTNLPADRRDAPIAAPPPGSAGGATPGR